jgi:DHA2 family multidrug resistance protein-like MFS transporter
MLLSALSFLGLSMTDFSTQQWQARGLMTLLGFSVASALLASSSAIMAAAPKEKQRRQGPSKPWPMSWARDWGLPCLA